MATDQSNNTGIPTVQDIKPKETEENPERCLTENKQEETAGTNMPKDQIKTIKPTTETPAIAPEIETVEPTTETPATAPEIEAVENMTVKLKEIYDKTQKKKPLDNTEYDMRKILWDIYSGRLYEKMPKQYISINQYLRDNISSKISYMYKHIRMAKTENLFGVPIGTYPGKTLLRFSAKMVSNEEAKAIFDRSRKEGGKEIPTKETLIKILNETLREKNEQPVDDNPPKDTQPLDGQTDLSEKPDTISEDIGLTKDIGLPEVRDLPEDYVLRVFEERFLTLPLECQNEFLEIWTAPTT